MLFNENELKKRILNNYTVFGNKLTVSIIAGNFHYNGNTIEYDFTRYTLSRDGSMEITNKDDIDDVVVSKMPYNKESYVIYLDNKNSIIISKFGITVSSIRRAELSNNKVKTKNFSCHKADMDLSDKKYYICAVLTGTDTIAGVILSDEEIKFELSEEFLYSDEFLFNSFTRKINIEEEITEKNNINNVLIGKPSDKQRWIENNLPDEDVVLDENGNVVEYYNHDTKLKFVDKTEKSDISIERNQYCLIGNNQIYGLKSTHSDNTNAIHSLYNYRSTVDGNVAEYLKDECKKIKNSSTVPNAITDIFAQSLAYVSEYINLQESEEDLPDECRDIIDIYKDKENNIWTYIVLSDWWLDDKNVPRNNVGTTIRIINDTIVTIDIMSGSVTRHIVLDIKAGKSILDSVIKVSQNSDKDTKISTNFEGGRLLFSSFIECNHEGYVSRQYYCGPELTIDIFRDAEGNVMIKDFKSSIYSKLDKYVYIRDTYGNLVKLDISNAN